MHASSSPTSFPSRFDPAGTLRVAASDTLREVLQRQSGLPRLHLSESAIAAPRAGHDAILATALAGHPGHALFAGARVQRHRFGEAQALCIAPPGEPRGAVLHIHGGGWCLGNARSLGPVLASLSAATSTVVASIDYRLAPEHRHPAAVDDCLRAARALLDRWAGEYGFGPGRVVVTGESAGAHLSLLTLLGLRDVGLRLAGAALTYGLFDLSNRLPSRSIPQPTPTLDDADCRFFAGAYLGHAEPDASASPWHLPQDAFADLPPALLCVGTADPLLDDSVGMHARWRAAGNEAWLVEYEAAPHAFDLLPVPEATHFSRMREAFIVHCLAR